MTYDPYNHYWLAEDGRLFSSKQQKQISVDDPDYAAWTAVGYKPQIWPRDESGNQTDQALQDVLAPYNLFANLVFYAADVRWRKASGGVIVTSLSAIPFLTDTVSRNTINSAWNYATQKGTTGYTVNWKMSDGSFIVLDGPKLTTLANDVADFVEKSFGCENDTVNKINGGTITTREQVDAAFAAISNVYP